MPYTKARLEHALTIFRETARYRLQRGLPSGNLERHLRRNYALRRAPKAGPARAVTVWQDRDGGKSDDDEYDPKEEQKKLKAAAVRKKKNRKRKLEEEINDERKLKRSKGEESRYCGNSAYLTLLLTTEKGRSLLADLARVHGTGRWSRQHDQESETEPSYWKRSSSTRRFTSSKLSIHELTDSELDVNGDNDVEEELTFGLRNGKVLNKEVNVSSAKDEEAQKKSIMQTSAKDNVEAHKDHHLFANTSPVKKIGSKSSTVTGIGNKEDNVTNNTALSLSKIVSSMLKRKVRPETSKPVTSSSSASLRSFSLEQTKHAQSFRDESGLITIETCYAHPIDFRYIPSAGEKGPCDFCSNYRMGVIGLGKKTISVFVDPDNPNQLQEIGDGWRSEGVRETKMCVSCALMRLMVMRCHALEANDKLDFEAEPARQQQFTRIPLLNSSEENRRVYLRHLFDPSKRPNFFRDAAGKREGPLPSCSLCPAPAFWKCCKWQKTDKTNTPCRIPDSRSATDTRSAVKPFSSSRSLSVAFAATYANPSSQVQMKREGTPARVPAAGHNSKISNENINGKKRQVICLDSDTDDDILPPTKQRITAVSVNRFTQPSQMRTPPLAQRSNSSTISQSGFRPPIQGCGLKLCHPCKLFIESQCNGGLDKKKVMEFLRKENKLGPRADLRFLFKGSEIERTYERKSKKG